MAYYATVLVKGCAGSLHTLCCWDLGDKLQELISLLDMGHLLPTHRFSIGWICHPDPTEQPCAAQELSNAAET